MHLKTVSTANGRDGKTLRNAERGEPWAGRLCVLAVMAETILLCSGRLPPGALNATWKQKNPLDCHFLDRRNNDKNSSRSALLAILRPSF